MGDLMAKKDYNITKITRLLLKMRDNCVQKEGEMYNDPERQEKYEALQAAVDLINNPSRLADAEPVRRSRWDYLGDGYFFCNECKKYIVCIGGDADLNYCPNCGAKMDEEEDANEQGANL